VSYKILGHRHCGGLSSSSGGCNKDDEEVWVYDEMSHIEPNSSPKSTRYRRDPTPEGEHIWDLRVLGESDVISEEVPFFGGSVFQLPLFLERKVITAASTGISVGASDNDCEINFPPTFVAN